MVLLATHQADPVTVCSVCIDYLFTGLLPLPHPPTEGSSMKLTQTDREMKELGGSLHVGAALITKYGRRLICDNILIVLGLLTFFLVVIYVFLSRLRII